ncbi:DUF6134 family protein [Hyphobacterium sp. HN65]|uniref:DUF6134 family protein n=1 Tax=Hyphobacterium lacteum TaxID=3116575 RepID=A0ABU7LM33_9PROT|nr:DUF6134 family protein [Hyphobacterium sp. HN65]MEE2524990.1 DUF6134 family protein [Hyphobacterium sp. HN65]
MKHVLTSLFLALSMPALGAAADIAAIPESGAIEFEVYRGNSSFGTHILRFQQDGDILRVVSDVDLRVRIGPLTVFRYEHDSVETYLNGELTRLEAETLKDGERLIVDLQRDGDVFTGRGTDGEGNSLSLVHPISLVPSSHWQGYSPDQQIILNTETGEEMPVTVLDMGRQTLEIGGQEIEAQHVRVEGSLTLDLWYGPDGEWLRCQFSARGQDITYVRRNL